MRLDALEIAAHTHFLDVFGVCHAVSDDQIGEGTLVLLGPKEPGFWRHVNAAPEFQDGAADPLDRWSTRTVTEIASIVHGTPLFPFGAPVRPFIGWALRSGRAWSSPVGLLVHDCAGLMVSYRGAVLLPDRLPLPENPPQPCDTCETRECLSRCPVGALTDGGYDIPACHAYLEQSSGIECMSQGCQVRRACPVSQRYQRDPAQSAFHMASFHRTT